MFTSKRSKIALAGVLALAVVGGTATAASAAQPEGSREPMWLWDGADGQEKLIQPGDPIAWDFPVYGHPNDTDYAEYDTYFQGPPEAEGVRVFLSNRGAERDYANLVGQGMNGFADPAQKTVLAPQLTLENISGDNMAAVKSNGGEFSLGISYTDVDGVGIYDVTFVHIVVQPGGTWTYEGDGPVVPGALTGEIGLEATTIAAPDGPLALSVPAGAKATFGAATLVNGKSMSTATLPEFTVSDGRAAARPGWTLTQSVADFTNGSATIAATHLGVAPKINATGTTSTGVQRGAAQVAGSATYPAPFAEAAAGSGVGETKLSADLTLIAPADAPAGTYTSKMTLTLVSK